MAEKKEKLMQQAANGFLKLPIFRQIGLLFGLSASIALGFAVVLWMQEPSYRPLYTNLSMKDSAEVIDTLKLAGIKYKLNEINGTILVPEKYVYKAKMKLASAGLSGSPDSAYDVLEKSSSFGTSQFMENKRFLHALEIELSRTISNINGVKTARVHLSVPKQSVFVADTRVPTASVFVRLGSGYRLEKEQVSAIVQMVASSISGLKAKNVSVTDQNGSLLTGDIDDAMALSKEQFEYQKNMQSYYEKRIGTMIAPMVGLDKVRVRVHANIDFTQKEQTDEQYNPDKKTVRSEQTISENNNSSAAGGAAGAIANQPGGAPGGKKSSSGSSRSQTVKNYELNKSISYVKSPQGNITNLSVAVVVDDASKVDPKTKKISYVPLSKEQMDKITNLVKTAIGYDEKRGDKVSVVNSRFIPPPEIKALPALAFYQQPWFWDIVKKTLGVLLGLIIAFGLLKPLLRNLAAKAKNEKKVAAADGSDAEAQLLSPEMLQLKQQQLESLKQVAKQEPSRVAQILKNWVGD